MARARFTTAAAIAGLCVACATTPSRYEWGDFESCIYDVTTNAGGVDVVAEIDRLTLVVEKARESGKLVPPGLHAHLGYLYSLNGEVDTAVAAFESEKELYPESTVFIDGILKRIEAQE